MVWLKKKYFLLGINAAIGTSFTPNKTSQSETSSTTSIPWLVYSISLNTLTKLLSTSIAASG